MATWDTAWEAKPAQADVPSTLGSTGRATRNETRQRLDQEHVILNTASTAASIHREGSARAYYQAAAPTLRPDGVTSLGASDDGRIWVDSDTNIAQVYDGSAWVDLNIAASDQVIDQGGGSDLLCKVIEIGDWDMNSTSSLQINHGLTMTTIRSITALIRMDTTNYVRPLNSWDTIAGNGTLAGAVRGSSVTTDIILDRKTGGFFDSVNFDATSFNRGWVTIWYTE